MASWCKTPNKPNAGNNADKPYDSAMQSCPVKEQNWIDLEYLYCDGTGVAGARYRVIDNDSEKIVAEGLLDNKGFAHCPLPMHVKNVSYNFFSDPPTVAYRKQPDLNPEYAKVKPGWYERMAGSISETGSWVWGTIQGDFNENQTVGQIAANAAITMIPIVDQAGDIRDLIANLKSLIWDKRYDDKWVWVAIVLTLIGLVPIIGSAAKGVLKTVAHGIRIGAKIPLDLLIDVINKFHKGNAIKWLRKLASDLPGDAKTIKETFKTFLANFRAKLVQLAERLPGVLGKQVKESIQSIDEIAKVADKNIDAAVKELQQGLNKALESGVDFERKGTTKTKNTRIQQEAEPPNFSIPDPHASSNKDAYILDSSGIPVGARKGLAKPGLPAKTMSKGGWPDLPSDHVRNFNSAEAITLKPGTKIYRIIDDGASPEGSYWVRELPTGRAEWRSDFAVKTNWNTNGKYVEYTVPEGDGLKVWQGEASAQQLEGSDNYLPGGGQQIWMPPNTVSPSVPKQTGW